MSATTPVISQDKDVQPRPSPCTTAPRHPARGAHPAGRKGIAHETVQVDLRSGEQLGETYRSLNPQCTVPALRTDDGPAGRQPRHRGLGRARFPSHRSLVARRPTKPRSPAGGGGWSSKASCPWQKRCRNSSPAMVGRALPGPVDYTDSRTGRTRAAKAAALLHHAGPAPAGRVTSLPAASFSVADITAVVAVGLCAS